MQRLIQDRYFAYDEIHGCDLATGEAVRLDRLPAVRNGNLLDSTGSLPFDSASGVPSACRRVKDSGYPVLVEMLNDGRDGDPRWVVADARNGAQAAAMVACAAADARRRGYVPVLVPLYLRWRDALAADLEERTLLLIGSFSKGLAAARAALVQAAASSPRPHVLLTFADRSQRGNVPRRNTEGASFVVREARAAYGATAAARRSRPATLAPDVIKLIERGAHAAELQRAGRHAAAERLLRDVAGSLARRQALVPAGTALVTLGRMLMDRGRATAAEKAFDEAAQLAQTAQDEAAMLDARLWQAAARTDAARLTDAEAMCRAVLLTR